MQKFQQLALQLDHEDPLKSYQEQFLFPRNNQSEKKVYLCGHSLGLQPKNTQNYIQEELDKWGREGVEAHFSEKNPWVTYHELVIPGLAQLTGALQQEIIAMNSLSINLHLLLISLYQPTKKKFKFLIEEGAFPSDRYALHSQLQLHGLTIEEGIIEIPTNSDGLIDVDMVEIILKHHADEIALILLPGVQYRTGQVLPIQRLTQLAHSYDCKIGWDLAHAIGNIFLELHEWQCDFAVWCHYKYLNAGPGAIGGCFIHQNYLDDPDLHRLAGWWGHEKSSRFDMPQRFIPMKSAEAWQLSNPPIFQLAALRASLEIFSHLNFSTAVNKSNALTEFARCMLQEYAANKITVVTPSKHTEHGAQLSLKITTNPNELVKSLYQRNNLCDFRKPNILRIAPVPLYNSFQDVYYFIKQLCELI